jgi:RNA polymerase sigma-70 factor (ECF subfamily)
MSGEFRKMAEKRPQPITRLLSEWRAGNRSSLDQITELLYPELRRIAHRFLDAEAGARTIQATELVHEVYVRLVQTDVDWRDRAHFFAVAARMMRRILVDRARARGREKRGGDAQRVLLEEVSVAAGERPLELLQLDDALNRLDRIDERKRRILELRFFGGLSYEETCEVLGISTSTLDRELRLAKAWLYQELKSS